MKRIAKETIHTIVFKEEEFKDLLIFIKEVTKTDTGWLADKAEEWHDCLSSAVNYELE